MSNPLEKDMILAQDVVVIGPVHRVCYNLPWGRSLLWEQQRVRHYLNGMKLRNLMFFVPKQQLIEIYFNPLPIKRIHKYEELNFRKRHISL